MAVKRRASSKVIPGTAVWVASGFFFSERNSLQRKTFACAARLLPDEKHDCDAQRIHRRRCSAAATCAVPPARHHRWSKTTPGVSEQPRHTTHSRRFRWWQAAAAQWQRQRAACAAWCVVAACIAFGSWCLLQLELWSSCDTSALPLTTPQDLHTPRLVNACTLPPSASARTCRSAPRCPCSSTPASTRRRSSPLTPRSLSGCERGIGAPSSQQFVLREACVQLRAALLTGRAAAPPPPPRGLEQDPAKKTCTCRRIPFSQCFPAFSPSLPATQVISQTDCLLLTGAGTKFGSLQAR